MLLLGAPGPGVAPAADPGAPQNTSPPTISGIPRDAETLTADEGTWEMPDPDDYDYQWFRCDGSNPPNCEAIAGETGKTYVLTQSDIGSRIKVEVVASILLLKSDPVSSELTGPVAPGPPHNVTAPQISGTTQDGQVLSVSDGEWVGAAPLEFIYQWRKCDDASQDPCPAISGATGRTYELTPDDVGSVIRAQVGASNQYGSATATSAPTAVVRAGPRASFTISDSTPVSFQQVTLRSTSTASPAGGTIASHAWDLDGDGGFDDATGATVQHSFRSRGPHQVGLEVKDNDGDADRETKQITVGNRGPTAGFGFDPDSPVIGQRVKFTSLSRDLDGSIRTQAWDLDNDGQFDDGTRAEAGRAFFRRGSYTVRLRVLDDAGASAVATRSIDVDPLPRMSPFPIVRLAGRITLRGAKIRVLSVRAPRGARVRVRCAGIGCPSRRRQLKTAARTGVVRFGRFERRLRAGARIAVLVTQPLKIGKYTRFRIRRFRRPARLDRCLSGQRLTPIRCPR
jgi:PKD repeat protein